MHLSGYSFCFRSSFSDFASKYGKDERFKGIDKMRDRESVFNEFVSDMRRREKEEKSSQREKVGINIKVAWALHLKQYRNGWL